MAKREYSYYPGCSSQKGASSSNMMKSVATMCEELDVQLNEIPDWNCCSASIGYGSGGELPRLVMSARNIALSEENNPDQDIVATCAACWLSTREAAERFEDDENMFKEANEALAEANLKLTNKTPIRHMAEVLIEDIGYEEIGKGVKKPLEGTSVVRPIVLSVSTASLTRIQCTWMDWSIPWGLIPYRPMKRRCNAVVAPWHFLSLKSLRK
jgi:heterodisulfide reductase subunit B